MTWKVTDPNCRRICPLQCTQCDTETERRIYPLDVDGGVRIWCDECKEVTEQFNPNIKPSTNVAEAQPLRTCPTCTGWIGSKTVPRCPHCGRFLPHVKRPRDNAV